MGETDAQKAPKMMGLKQAMRIRADPKASKEAKFKAEKAYNHHMEYIVEALGGARE